MWPPTAWDPVDASPGFCSFVLSRVSLSTRPQNLTRHCKIRETNLNVHHNPKRDNKLQEANFVIPAKAGIYFERH
ncbi:hypothetical protein V22_38290 [Calycomorphotria hydatis]|uniref:Uncharacterized protein n=1 Tax=Calycomorphotria hydatis TaxID=2528027 RepID=A0A517TDV7_9PLAN|nr:hypothetical protein V22_38290 [Calycomorphotria hydatis]